MDISSETIINELNEFSLTATDECLSKLLELCRNYHISPEEIIETWIAFSVSSGNGDMKLSKSMLDTMEKEELMKKKVKTPKLNKSQNCFSATSNATLHAEDYNISSQDSPSTRTNLQIQNRTPSLFSPNSMSPAQAAPAKKYSSRTGSGDIVCTFGEIETNWKHSNEFSCSVRLYPEDNALIKRYNYMFEKIRDTAAVLNDMIECCASFHQNNHGIEEWGHLLQPSVEHVPVIGRICADSTGKLSSSSVLLEGSQEISSAQIVPLDVSQLDQFSLFPGQIIAGQGINMVGKKLMLKNIYEGIYPPKSSEVPDLSNCLESLSVVVAAGPFTTSDSLSYEPLTDLIKYVKINEPHICILVGPLVDVKHDEIEKGNMSNTYEDLFKELVALILNSLKDVDTKVVLVSSSQDAHHDNVYPTPPYHSKEHSRKLLFAPDPCMLNIEGVVFGVTSTDVLFHLGKEEINLSPQSSDRLGRLCDHLLAQRNFYPLYPPNEEVNIDYLHYETHAMLPVMPHIMILPSDLRYFVKNVKGCCFINPQRLTKHYSGGTYARLKVKGVEKSKFTGSVVENIKVEVLKI